MHNVNPKRTMKTIYTMMALCLSILMMSACESDLDQTVFDSDTAKAATLQNIASTYILSADKGSETAIAFSWQKPDMGYQAEVTTTLEMDVKGKNFAGSLTLFSTKTGTTYSITTSELNESVSKLLTDYGMSSGATDIEFRLSSSISEAASSLRSNVVSTNITPY